MAPHYIGDPAVPTTAATAFFVDVVGAVKVYSLEHRSGHVKSSETPQPRPRAKTMTGGKEQAQGIPPPPPPEANQGGNAGGGAAAAGGTTGGKTGTRPRDTKQAPPPVSYTHLTLPTIYSV